MQVAVVNRRLHHYFADQFESAGRAAVQGSLVITYNGSLRPPKKVGTYNVVAAFTSADTNYTNATATSSLVIQRREHRDDDHDDDEYMMTMNKCAFLKAVQVQR